MNEIFGKIDDEQQRLDEADGNQDHLVSNQYLTDLLLTRVDALTNVILDAGLDDTDAEGALSEIHNFLLALDANDFEDASRLSAFDLVLSRFEASFALNDGENALLPEEVLKKADIDIWKKKLSTAVRNGIKKNLAKRDGEIPVYDGDRTDPINIKYWAKVAAQSKAINEHYLAVLKYPSDKDLIKQIFESMVVNMPDEGNGSKVYIAEAHPLHLAYIAKSINLPDDFKFDVYEYEVVPAGYQKPKHYRRGKAKKPMTLGELIQYQKDHLVTKMALTGGSDMAESYDDEFLLALLNMTDTAPTRRNAVIGRNLQGKHITFGDIIDRSAIDLEGSAPDISYGGQIGAGPGNVTIQNMGDYGLKETGRITTKHSPEVADTHVSSFDAAVGYVQQNEHTCNGLHAASALLSTKLITPDERKRYVDQAFSSVVDGYLESVKQLSIVTRKSLKSKIAIVGHVLELYLEHKDQFNSEQRRFFGLVAAELPNLMAEIEKFDITNGTIDQFAPALSHLYEVLDKLNEAG